MFTIFRLNLAYYFNLHTWKFTKWSILFCEKYCHRNGIHILQLNFCFMQFYTDRKKVIACKRSFDRNTIWILLINKYVHNILNGLTIHSKDYTWIAFYPNLLSQKKSRICLYQPKISFRISFYWKCYLLNLLIFF